MKIPPIITKSIPKASLKRKGDLVTLKDDGQLDTLTVGEDGTVLTADSTQSNGFKWLSVNAHNSSAVWGTITGTLDDQADLSVALQNKSDVNHTHIASQVGLGNVTNDKQVKAATASVDGNLVSWSGAAGDAVIDSGKKIADLALATHNHDGIYEPANPNIQSHIISTDNPHQVTADQVLPDQTGQTGKFLTSDGASVFWGDASAGTPPAGSGFRHISSGIEDPFAKLVADEDVAPNAGIAESKLNLNYATHTNANDPTTDQKAALSGTSGTAGAGNKFVTDADQRNSDARTPVAHGSGAHTGIIGTPDQVGLGNVPNVDATDPANIVQDSTHRFVTDAEKSAWDSGTSGATPPTGTGFRHITDGVEDAAAHLVTDADVSSGAAIAESKLALNFPTHDTVNDPTADQKAALAGTSGTPGAGNKFVTDADPRLSGTGVEVDPVFTASEAANFATGDKAKLDGIEAGAQVNSANDPSADEKAALAGTSGSPGSANKFVTDADPRNTDARTPVAHGSAAHSGTIGTPDQVGLGNVPNLDTSNPANITQDSSHRFVTDAEKSNWNEKQDALGFTAVPDNRTVAGHALSSDVSLTKDDVGLSNVTNEAQIPASLGTAPGDLIGYSETGVPVRIPVGSDTYVLTADSSQTAGMKWAPSAAGGAASFEIPENLSYSGFPLTGIAGEPLSFGQAVYQNSADKRLYLAKADAVGTMTAVGVVVVGGDVLDTVTYIDNGYIRNDAWSWTAGSSSGGKIYVSPATAGLITQPAPSAIGDQLQELGYAEDTNILRIIVNSLLIEIGSGLTDLASEVTGVLPETNGGAGAVTGLMKADGTGTVSAAVAGTDYISPTGSETLINKRMNPRVVALPNDNGTLTSSDSAYNVDQADQFILTALEQDTNFGAPGGTPADGQKLVIRIKDNGTVRALTWNAMFRESADLLKPAATTLSKTLYLGFIYNAADSTFDLMAKLDNF
jgi:hypothetical protein